MMTDQELNEKLAKAMGWTHHAVKMRYEGETGEIDQWTKPDGSTQYGGFSYRHKAIFAENVMFLTDMFKEFKLRYNAYHNDGYWCDCIDMSGDDNDAIKVTRIHQHGEDICKAVALARIAAGETK